MHLASHLRRYAQGGAVVVGDIHRLYELPFAYLEQVLDGAVHRVYTLYWVADAHLVVRVQCLAMLEREVGHLVDGAHTLHVYPLHHLARGKAGHAHLLCHCLHLSEVHSQ